MTTEIDDLEEAELDELEEMEDDEEEDLSLSSQLLQLQDDLNDMLGKQEFYGEAISALFRTEDCDVLYTRRQQTGMIRTGREICEIGGELSERLDTIRAKIGIIGKQIK